MSLSLFPGFLRKVGGKHSNKSPEKAFQLFVGLRSLCPISLEIHRYAA